MYKRKYIERTLLSRRVVPMQNCLYIYMMIRSTADLCRGASAFPTTPSASIMLRKSKNLTEHFPISTHFAQGCAHRQTSNPLLQPFPVLVRFQQRGSIMACQRQAACTALRKTPFEDAHDVVPCVLADLLAADRC